jgi:NADPH:quinone reductase-like Zn-dependent oxidoreductase
LYYYIIDINYPIYHKIKHEEGTMKAIQINAYGGSDLPSFEETPLPVHGENDVLIHVQAASINPVDVAYRAGYMVAYAPLNFPATLGSDIAGTIEAVGSAVNNLKVGDAVYGRTDGHRLGGYAEYVIVSASEVARKPASLDFVQAASIPHVGVTAWCALINTAGLQAGQTVLIHGAAGGVGSIAVQLAKSRGARVIGTASTVNQAFLKELGVDEAVDYTAGPFEDKIKGVDIVFDTIGGDTQARSYQCLKPGGLLVSIVEPPSEDAAAAHGVRAAFAMAMPPSGPVLNELTALIESGKIKPVVSTVLPLHEARRAHDMISTRHTRGKIVLQVL